MMTVIKIGDRVRVLDNAFGDSAHPSDVAARGKLGNVVWVEGDGRIEVQTDDDDFLPLMVDEVEVLGSGQNDND